MIKIKQRLQELSDLIAELDTIQYVEGNKKNIYLAFTECAVRERYYTEMRELEELLYALDSCRNDK